MKLVKDRNLKLSFCFNLSITILLLVLLVMTTFVDPLDGYFQFSYNTFLILFGLIGIYYTWKSKEFSRNLNARLYSLVLLFSMVSLLSVSSLLFLQFVMGIDLNLFIFNVSISTLFSILNVFLIFRLRKEK